MQVLFFMYMLYIYMYYHIKTMLEIIALYIHKYIHIIQEETLSVGNIEINIK